MTAKEFRKVCDELGLTVLEDQKYPQANHGRISFFEPDLSVRTSDSNGMKSVFLSFTRKDGEAKVFSYEMTTTEMISGQKSIKWFLTPTYAKTSSADMLKKLALSQLKFLARIQQTAKEIEIKNAALEYEKEFTSIEETPEKFFNRMSV